MQIEKIIFLINNLKFVRIFYQFKIFYKIKDKLINRKKINIDRQNIRLRKNSTVLEEEDLVKIFNKLKLRKNIMIHTGLATFNKLKDDNKTLYNSLLKYNYNNLLAPYFPIKQSYYNNINIYNYFDRKSGVGSFSDYLNSSQKNNLLKSLHLTHTMIALGKDKNNLVGEHNKSRTPFDKRSPFYKALLYDFDILLVGVDLNKLTAIHIYEDLLEEDPFIPIYSNRYIKSKIYDSKFLTEVKTKVRHLAYIINDIEQMRPVFIKKEVMRVTKFDNYEIIAVNIRKLTFVLLEELLKGNSIYGKLKIRKKQKMIIQSKIDNLKFEIEKNDTKSNLNEN